MFEVLSAASNPPGKKMRGQRAVLACCGYSAGNSTQKKKVKSRSAPPPIRLAKTCQEGVFGFEPPILDINGICTLMFALV